MFPGDCQCDMECLSAFISCFCFFFATFSPQSRNPTESLVGVILIGQAIGCKQSPPYTPGNLSALMPHHVLLPPNVGAVLGNVLCATLCPHTFGVCSEVAGCSHVPVLVTACLCKGVSSAAVYLLPKALSGIVMIKVVVVVITVIKRQPSSIFIRIVRCKWQVIIEQSEHSFQVIKVKLVVTIIQERLGCLVMGLSIVVRAKMFFCLFASGLPVVIIFAGLVTGLIEHPE